MATARRIFGLGRKRSATSATNCSPSCAATASIINRLRARLATKPITPSLRGNGRSAQSSYSGCFARPTDCPGCCLKPRGNTQCRFQNYFDGFPSFITYDAGSLVQRHDGKQTPDYLTVSRAPTREEIEDHLAGRKSIGRSPLFEDATAVWGAIDIDVYQCRDGDLEAISNALAGSQGLLCRSKSRGLHFFVFCERSPAADLVEVLDYFRSKLPPKYRAKSKELFPKQVDPKDCVTPSAMNLPLFGSTREPVEVFAFSRKATCADLTDKHALLSFVHRDLRLTADQVADLAARNRERKKGGRPVREQSDVGYREPSLKEVAGRQEFLFKVGASMRARGADMETIKAQLVEIDKHYAEIGHPLWAGKGRIEEARIASALKQIAKFEQGTPSGLTYDMVAKLNDEFAMLDLDGNIEILDCELADLKTWNIGNFKTKLANRRVRIGKDTVPVAALWLADVDRREYVGIVIEPATYRGRAYNLWRGFAVEPMQGDPSPFLLYVNDVLCCGDAALARWVLHYIADAVQRPTEPSPPTAIAIRGAQGQGKSFFFKFLKAIFGRSAREVAEAERLLTRFNRSLAGCTIVGAEEAIFSGDPRLAQALKTFISSDLWTYEEKHKAAVEMKNVHRLIATTNSEHAVLIEDDDRRWTVIEVQKRWDLETDEGKREATAFWEPLYAFKDGDGPAIVLDYLLKLEVDRDLIRFAHGNSAKADDKIMSDPVIAFLDEVAETLTLPDDRAGRGVVSYQSIMEALKGSIHARGLSAEAVSKRIREIVPGAEKSRSGVFVERAQIDQCGFVQYFEKTRQRGLFLGSPDEFRQAVTRVTKRQYGTGDLWCMWEMEGGHSDRQPFDGSYEELKAAAGR